MVEESAVAAEPVAAAVRVGVAVVPVTLFGFVIEYRKENTRKYGTEKMSER